MPATLCSVCRRETKVETDGSITGHLRLYEGKLERCPGGSMKGEKP